MRRIAELLILLALSSSLHAQSIYDFTLSNVSNSVSGSGSFEVGTWTTAGGPVLYPINNLSGTLNGLPLSLTPGYIITNPNSPTAEMNGNAFYMQSLPIAPNWPLYFQSGQRMFSIHQSDFFQPGVTGQTLGDSQGILVGGVTFAVSPAVQPLLSRKGSPVPPSSPLRLRIPTSQAMASLPLSGKPVAAFRANHNFEIGFSVTAAVATGIAIYEWHKHRQHWDAYHGARIQ